MDSWTYLRDYGPFTDKVSPEGYRFNKHGVCVNADRVNIYESKHHKLCFDLCCCNGYWDYGLKMEVSYGTFSGSYGPCRHPGPIRDTQERFFDRPIYRREFYPSREAAYAAALDRAEEFFGRVDRDNENKSCAKVLEAIASARTPQLTLF